MFLDPSLCEIGEGRKPFSVSDSWDLSVSASEQEGKIN